MSRLIEAVARVTGVGLAVTALGGDGRVNPTPTDYSLGARNPIVRLLDARPAYADDEPRSIRLASETPVFHEMRLDAGEMAVLASREVTLFGNTYRVTRPDWAQVVVARAKLDENANNLPFDFTARRADGRITRTDAQDYQTQIDEVFEVGREEALRLIAESVRANRPLARVRFVGAIGHQQHLGRVHWDELRDRDMVLSRETWWLDRDGNWFKDRELPPVPVAVSPAAPAVQPPRPEAAPARPAEVVVPSDCHRRRLEQLDGVFRTQGLEAWLRAASLSWNSLRVESRQPLEETFPDGRKFVSGAVVNADNLRVGWPNIVTTDDSNRIAQTSITVSHRPNPNNPDTLYTNVNAFGPVTVHVDGCNWGQFTSRLGVPSQ